MSDPRRMAASPSGRPDDEDDLPEPPRLRALRRLVTVLTVTLILGMLTIAGALAVRITRPEPALQATAFDPASVTAPAIRLPPGTQIIATGAAGTALLLAVEGPEGARALLVVDAASGAILRRVPVTQ